MGRSFDPEVVPVLLLPDFQAALPTAGRYTQLVFGGGFTLRVGDGIRTRDTQIHKLNTKPAEKPPKLFPVESLREPPRFASRLIP